MDGVIALASTDYACKAIHLRDNLQISISNRGGGETQNLISCELFVGTVT